jgi:NADH dehydrogenase [ubiquinone] 1 alpha subcomplex assembly factor 5
MSLLIKSFFTKSSFTKSSFTSCWKCSSIRRFSQTNDFSAPAQKRSHQVVFDTHAKLLQRSRAALGADSKEFDYLRDEAAKRLLVRLSDITRSFPVAVDLGANTGNLLASIIRSTESTSNSITTQFGGIRELHMIDSSREMLFRDESLWRTKQHEQISKVTAVVSPLEGVPLPFQDSSVDLILSSMSLHWVNDLPGLFSEVLRVLRPDGCFMLAMPGGETLQELRSSFYSAEMKLFGGASPHVSPMVSVADVGNLLTAAGFSLATVDADTFTIEYASPSVLFRHLRGMGEGNAALGRREGARRSLITEASKIYVNEFPGEEDGIIASVQIIFGIGWKPDLTQPQPKERGSVPKGFGVRKKST